LIRVLASASLSVLVSAQFDGNPHGWDRKRRCDHFDYSPACGACEGVGGIVWSDNNSDCNITSCEPVPDQPDPSTLKKPRWAPDFQVISHEILIGKNTQGCFQAFPWNDSIGEHCYKPQDVKLYSDMTNKRAIREDGTQNNGATFGNVSVSILHQGPNMWILNHIPNKSPPPDKVYMVVCTQPAEGGDHSKPGVQPIQYNWTNNLAFIAREKIGVEYVWKTMTLDHWAFGPHHAWLDPETGVIVRMWQPFNGLQVFEPGSWKEGVQDPSLWPDFNKEGTKAPADALPNGSANVRIKCSDDGFMDPSDSWKSGVQDLKRARTKLPRVEFKGHNFQTMSKTLNGWLLKHAPNSVACHAWTIDELQQFQRLLFSLRDPELDSVYQKTNDNRRLRLVSEKEWAELNALSAKDPELAAIRRDGHCHEAVMWYVHHLPEKVKEQMKDVIALPLLPEVHHGAARQRFSPELEAVFKAYETTVSCQDCHSGAHPPAEESIVV